jgi:hypothetical protein
MAKLVGPLFSLEARRTLNKTITYQNRPSGTAAYKHTVPHDTKTATQLAHRAFVTQAVQAWQSLTALEKAQWNIFVKT